MREQPHAARRGEQRERGVARQIELRGERRQRHVDGRLEAGELHHLGDERREFRRRIERVEQRFGARVAVRIE
jgi:ABC-type phosphate transport system auxiliary subunit